MDAAELFADNSTVLPRQRNDEDFGGYLAAIFRDYLRSVSRLDRGCRLGARILDASADIEKLGDTILRSVRTYLSGSPASAYGCLSEGIDFVYERLNGLKSVEVEPKSVGPLYRLARTDGVLPTKERLFHTPFRLRHKVGQHRYGIPGFPCLYLGGSLKLCAAECRIEGADLPTAAVAAFAFRKAPRFLDFGYRPSVIGKIARAALSASKPGLDDLVVNYAVCWPLLAACSIKRMHDGEPFAHEYVVPQMVLQWVMDAEECDGIRFFSTRFESASPVREGANYVFPATHDIDRASQFSARLVEMFEFTDPILWSGEAAEVEADLSRLAKAPL